MKELRADLYGRVQGIGFRNFIRRKAEESAIKGYVKNREDGSVEVVAQGDKNLLEKFLITLKTGYSSEKVEKVSYKWKEIEDRYDKFIISYT